MVIRLDAKPLSVAAATPQQKYSAPTVQVRESRDLTDRKPSPVMVKKTTHSASTLTSLSTSAAGESSSTSQQLTSSNGNELVQAAISIEGSKGACEQQQAAPSPLTNTPVALSITRQRFVKKTAGARDIELKHSSPSSSLSSGSSGKPSSSRNSERAGLGQMIVQPQMKEDVTGTSIVAATGREDPGDRAAQSDAGSNQSTNVSTNVSRSVANRIAMFEQRPTLTDSSPDISSIDVTPTSSVSSQRMRPLSSVDLRPATTGKGPKQRAPVVHLEPGKFKINTSLGDVTPTSAKLVASPGSDGQKEQVTPVKGGGNRVFDSTRL